MSVYIKIEDLAGNAMIELLERKKSGKVSIPQLKEYGMAVVSELNDECGDEYFCIFSREAVSSFFHDYTEYFDVVDNDNERYISIKDGVTIPQLKNAFRRYLSIDMLIAFVSTSSLKTLGIGG